MSDRPHATERIIVLSGALEGRQYELRGTLTIGRNPENDICLEDREVSRRHAVIIQTPAGAIVRDLGSGNGTFVCGRRVRECRLGHGDVIQIGPLRLRFEGHVTQLVPGSAGAREVSFEGTRSGSVRASSAEAVYKTFFRTPNDDANREQLQELRSRLRALYEANQLIASERDLASLFERVMDQIFALVPAHNGVILIRDGRSGRLLTEYVKSGLPDGQVNISSSIVHRACENGEAVITYDAADDTRFDAGNSIIAENISSAMCAPLRHQGETLGVLYVDTRGTTNAFVQSDLELLVALAGPAAIAIKNAQFLAKLEQSYRDTLTVLANAIELRDRYTVGHTWRVSNFAVQIARELDWPEERLRDCEIGGALHDVGKIAIDDAILSKPGKLTAEEFEAIKIHPERGARMLQDAEFLIPIIPYALYHHERWDGKGYPFGLSGEDIPMEGRLMSVADAFDAMTSHRPYRRGLAPEDALQIICGERGAQFDPRCVDALVKAYREGKIERILQDYYKKENKSIACPFCATYIPVPDAADLGDELTCGVCHRRHRLRQGPSGLYGELLAAYDVVSRGTASLGED